MNTANLQLEGLIMAIASINHVLVRKGLVSVEEIDVALLKAQANMADASRNDELSGADHDSINLPLRMLQLANQCAPEADVPTFSEMSRMVDEMKPSQDLVR
ncbi:hypothetical protein NGM99_21085 [Mesorhizobium sp. RP14(2022)]|uniref:Uncharacterized protein n=2 Tax=Mesorhizobium liriopis TaxID=2953882 RepID=A0ABT1CBT8_9HYPH|nr:hypothetical protein [Mesorhizobium liriopis]MCO6052287.1 hypothetical protein [Mesorhizobium liriopis]